jgi:hypothetical protein
LGSVFLAVAVDMTVFTRRLRVKGTPAPLFHGIGHESTALRTESSIFATKRIVMDFLLLVAMLRCAINPDKVNKNHQILVLLTSKLFHVMHHR